MDGRIEMEFGRAIFLARAPFATEKWRLRLENEITFDLHQQARASMRARTAGALRGLNKLSAISHQLSAVHELWSWCRARQQFLQVLLPKYRPRMRTMPMSLV